MDGCKCFVKITLPCMEELMAQTDPPKEGSTVKKMNAWLKFLTSYKMTHYFKEWISGVLKKIYCLYKNLMLQINPLNSSCSQKLHHPERK